jgi:hypothetical protein
MSTSSVILDTIILDQHPLANTTTTNHDNAPLKIPKKRGRKPLHAKNESNQGLFTTTTVEVQNYSRTSNTTTNGTDTHTSPNVVDETVFISPKQPKVMNTVHKKNALIAKPIIVHLNVNTVHQPPALSTLSTPPSSLHHDTNNNNNSNFEYNFFQYSPELVEEPTGYDANASSLTQSALFSTLSDVEQQQHNETMNNTTNVTTTNSSCATNKSTSSQRKKTNYSRDHHRHVLLQDLLLANNNKWVEQTSYWCHWDCNPFTNTPFGIPIKFKNDKFHVHGCFCSLECAVSYNFYNGQENIDNKWENYNLINMLSNMISYKVSVNPAIDRRCLKSFGGHLTIDEFRQLSKSNTTFNILSYPMVSVVEHVEEVTCSKNDVSLSFDSSMWTPTSQSTYFPFDKSIIHKLEQNMGDKNLQSTLEKSMHMTFSA